VKKAMLTYHEKEFKNLRDKTLNFH